MAETIGEALVLLQRLGGYVVGMSLDNNNPTEHNVLHKFKETMIVLYYAVKNNCSLIMSKGDHYVNTADDADMFDKLLKEIIDERRQIQAIFRRQRFQAVQDKRIGG